MHSKTVLVTTMALLGGICFGAALATAQSGSLRQQLVGTWTNVSTYNLMPDGKRIEPQGPNGKGTLMMDAAGHFAWILIKPDIPKFASNNRQTGTDAENRAVVQGALAYYGTYDLDASGKSLLMRIEYSSFANFNGQQQRREIKLENDELTVINSTGASGGTAYVIWKRVK
ncbi:MAG TPA: lipocalin-like domain-containing protein [Xanthobacteraceae bacterium]